MGKVELKARPDIGLNVAVFAHIIEYYGKFIRAKAMDKGDLIDLALVAESISNMWYEHRADYDKDEESRQETIKALEESVTDLLEVREALQEKLANTEAKEIKQTPKNKGKAGEKQSK